MKRKSSTSATASINEDVLFTQRGYEETKDRSALSVIEVPWHVHPHPAFEHGLNEEERVNQHVPNAVSRYLLDDQVESGILGSITDPMELLLMKEHLGLTKVTRTGLSVKSIKEIDVEQLMTLRAAKLNFASQSLPQRNFHSIIPDGLEDLPIFEPTKPRGYRSLSRR